MAPSVFAQIAGLVLFVVLVAAAWAARTAWTRAMQRRVWRSADRPLPGRTRNEAGGSRYEPPPVRHNAGHFRPSRGRASW